jgi:hypothetical protein
MSEERAALRSAFAANFAGEGIGPLVARSATPISKIARALVEP